MKSIHSYERGFYEEGIKEDSKNIYAKFDSDPGQKESEDR